MGGKGSYLFKPIGYVKTNYEKVPRHWTVSDLEGEIVIDEIYMKGLEDIKPGDKVVILFCFHKASPFSLENLRQKPPHKDEMLGVFSTCSPLRPNPIGLSVVDVMDVQYNVLRIRRLDMLDGTPILDIKPYIEYPNPSQREKGE